MAPKTAVRYRIEIQRRHGFGCRMTTYRQAAGNQYVANITAMCVGHALRAELIHASAVRRQSVSARQSAFSAWATAFSRLASEGPKPQRKRASVDRPFCPF